MAFPGFMTASLQQTSLLILLVTTAGACSAQSRRLTTAPAGLPPRGLTFGLAGVGNINYSVQAFPAQGATFQKNSIARPTGELLAAYTGPQGWRLESGLGLGSVAAITLEAREAGQRATVSFGTVQVPLRVYRYLTLGPARRFSLGPHAGLQVVTLFGGEKTVARRPIHAADPAYGSESRQFRVGQAHTITYQVGASVNYVAPTQELSAFVRYTNSFGNPVAAQGRWEYDRQGLEQPARVATSRLENVAVGVLIRGPFYSR